MSESRTKTTSSTTIRKVVPREVNGLDDPTVSLVNLSYTDGLKTPAGVKSVN